jgi:hypothetical protein
LHGQPHLRCLALELRSSVTVYGGASGGTINAVEFWEEVEVVPTFPDTPVCEYARGRAFVGWVSRGVCRLPLASRVASDVSSF